MVRKFARWTRRFEIGRWFHNKVWKTDAILPFYSALCFTVMCPVGLFLSTSVLLCVCFVLLLLWVLILRYRSGMQVLLWHAKRDRDGLHFDRFLRRNGWI